jgi:predicted ABC-type ATPase
VREALEQEMTDGGWPGDNILDAVSGSVFFDQEIAALGGELGAFVMRTTDGELRGLIPYIKNAETKTIELVWHTGMKFSEDVEGMLRASTTLAKLSSDMGYSLRIRPSSAPGDTMTLRSQLLARGGKDKGFDDSLYWTPAESRKGFGLEGEISPPYAPGVPIILPQAQQYQVKLAQEAMDELLTKTDGFKIALLPDEDSATARLLSTDDIAIHWDENPPTGLQDAIVHEYGHYIDKNLMAGPGNWGSSELLFNDFYTVAKQSPTMQGIIKGEFSLLHDPSNALGADATYLLQGREMWARAFNQYIARHSGNMDMLTNLQKLQQDPLLRFQVWQDSEFKLIEVEIEKLLKGAGLLKKEIPTGVPLHQVHYINPKNGKPVVTAPMNESDANDLLAKLQDENIKAEALPEGAPAPIIDDISIGDGPPVSPEYVQKIHELGITKYPDKGDKAWEILGDEKDTLAKFTNDNGDWTPERTQLHNDIIAAHFADKTPPPTGERSAFFTAGGGASGKSGMRFNYKGQDVDLDFLEVQGDTVYIDPDRIKKMIPEYKEMQDAGDAYAAGAVHEESSILSKMIAARARKEGYNVVFDTTGSSGRFLKNIQDYADMGYKTHVSMVSIPTNTAISRSITRALKKGGKSEGRFVAISALKQAHKDASLQLIKWQKMKDITEWRVYDNSGDSIKLVAEKKTGQKPAVYDDKTFKDIKNKANEGVIRPVKQKPETGFSTPEQGAGVQVGVTVEHLKATLYSVNNKIAGWNKKLKKNPDDIDAQKKKAELEVEKENLKEQIKGAGGKPVATKPAAAKTPKITQWKVSYEKPDGGKVEQMFDSEIEAKNFAVEVPISETVTKPKIEKVEISTRPRAPREKPDPKPDPKLVHQPDERRVVPGGITKERDTAVLNKRMQEGYTGSGAVGLKQSVMNQTQARASADPRWHKRGTVRKPYDNTQSAEWNALNQQRTEDLEGWEQVRAAFGYRDSAYGASSEQAVMAQLINNWARTSSDRDWRGVVMQMAVKEEFDTPVRVFAADYWNNAVESDKIVKLAEEKIAEFPEMMGALRAFVRAQYEQTQAFLKEMDISEVTLYRGMRIPQSAVEAAPEDGGVPWGAGLSTVTLSDNPIASWSIRHSVSRGVFSSGTMLRASCPREMVFSCPLTGFGCASEYEVLILNAGDNSAWMAQHGTVHIDDERLARISDDIIKLQEQELKYMEEETNLTALNGGAGPEYGTYERSRLYEVRNERRQAEQQRANLQRLQENRVEQWQYRKETDLKNYIHQALQENPELAGKTVKIPKKKMPTDMTLAERKVADLKKKISGQKRKISNRKKKAEEARFKAAISRAKLGETGVGGYIRSGETYGGMTWEGKQFHFSTWNIDSLERDANWYDEQAAKMESELENMNESLAAAEEEVKREVVTKSVYQVRLARLMERV